MDHDRDKLIGSLLAAARLERMDTSEQEKHFETRLMARLAEQRRLVVPWHALIWRFVPAFAVVTAIVLACSLVFDPAQGDLFAAIANGQDDALLVRGYFTGE